jgi:glycosyltransferase involved in cell wall biosynthesis
MTAVKVLSINVFTMGHISYQLGLERAFEKSGEDVDFHSIHLSQVNRGDIFGRAAYWLLTRRLAIDAAADSDWYRLRSELASSLFLRRRLQRELPTVKPDVLHIHTQGIALLAPDLFRQTPAVVSIDCTSALLARIHPSPAARTYQPIIRLERRCFRAAAHIVCWTRFAQQSLINDYAVPFERTSVVRPSVRYDVFPSERAVRQGGGKFRLLFVGTDFTRKGGHDLLAVFRDGLHTSCELDIVSNGAPSLDDLPGLRVHRALKPLSAELMRLYAEADVFVLPTYEDASPMVFLEAMAAGLPCIGTHTLAVPEIVQDGVRGITVPAGDRPALRSAIECLRDDATMRQELGRAGRRFCESECDDALNARRLAQIFHNCASSAAVRPGNSQIVGATEMR